MRVIICVLTCAVSGVTIQAGTHENYTLHPVDDYIAYWYVIWWGILVTQCTFPLAGQETLL